MQIQSAISFHYYFLRKKEVDFLEKYKFKMTSLYCICFPIFFNFYYKGHRVAQPGRNCMKADSKSLRKIFHSTQYISIGLVSPRQKESHYLHSLRVMSVTGDYHWIISFRCVRHRRLTLLILCNGNLILVQSKRQIKWSWASTYQLMYTMVFNYIP